MKGIKEKLLITVTGVQKDKSGEESKIELTTEATVYDKNDNLYIVYEETELSGMEGTTTTLKVQGKNKLMLKRYGNNSSTMVFEEGKRYVSQYETVFGNFIMEVFTKNLVIDIDESNKKGRIEISYDLAVTGLSETQNQLNIRF